MIVPTRAELSEASAPETFSRELEICAETLQACEATQAGGADRIELCSGLSEGGLTPSHGLLRAALAHSKLPIHILLRPRAGHFVYSAAEFAVMCDDLRHAASLGAAGFVAGCLTTQGEIDELRTRTLVELAGELPVTFHRAIDHAADLDTALEKAFACGCKRILTSGGQPNVTLGINRLAAFSARAAGRLRIAAGGGVTLANASELCRIAGLDLHASLRAKAGTASGMDPLWQQLPSGSMDVSAELVRALAVIVHKRSPPPFQAE